MDSPKNSNDNASGNDVVVNPPADSVLGLNCRSIRFGTLRTVPNGAGFHFTPTGVAIFFRWTNNSSCTQPTVPFGGSSENLVNTRTFNISVGWRHIRELQYYIGPALSVVFVSVDGFVGHRLRGLFRMVEHAGGTYPVVYFDPDSQYMYHRFITVVANTTRQQDYARLEQSLEQVDIKSTIVTPLDFKTANRQLAFTMPPMALEQTLSRFDEFTSEVSAKEATVAEEKTCQRTKVSKSLADAAVGSSDQTVAKHRRKSFVKRKAVSQLSSRVKIKGRTYYIRSSRRVF